MATSALAVQNWFETTLSGGINASDTDIGLNSVPTGTEGYLIIEPDGTTTREVIYYTSKTSNSVVLTSAANGRGVDGTTAQSHAAGATVRMQITSGYWNALQDGTALATSAITTAKVADSAITPAKWTNPYKFSATGTSTSVSSSAVIVKFSTEAYDSNSNYDPSTGLYTAPVAGYYQFTATIVISTSNGGNNIGGFYAYKNGSNIRTLMSWAVGAISSNTGGTASFSLQLAANDTVSIYANNSIATSYGQGAFEGHLVSIT